VQLPGIRSLSPSAQNYTQHSIIFNGQSFSSGIARLSPLKRPGLLVVGFDEAHAFSPSPDGRQVTASEYPTYMMVD